MKPTQVTIFPGCSCAIYSVLFPFVLGQLSKFMVASTNLFRFSILSHYIPPIMPIVVGEYFFILFLLLPCILTIFRVCLKMMGHPQSKLTWILQVDISKCFRGFIQRSFIVKISVFFWGTWKTPSWDNSAKRLGSSAGLFRISWSTSSNLRRSQRFPGFGWHLVSVSVRASLGRGEWECMEVKMAKWECSECETCNVNLAY